MSDEEPPRHEPPVLPTRSKKLQTAIDSIKRTRWHTRQRPQEPVRFQRHESITDFVGSSEQEPAVSQYPDSAACVSLHEGRFRAPRGKAGKSDRSEPNTHSKEDLLFSKRSVRFLGSAATPASFLPETLPEVAFLGRSNVGKSSLINGLLGSAQAKTSHKPGFTRTINFFELGKALSLVDLPGYGFAYAGEEKVTEWQSLVKAYVKSRKTLKRVCLLIDSRHGLKPQDIEAIDLFESEKRPFQVVMTKSELVDQVDLARRYVQVSEALAQRRHWVKPIVPCSAHKKQGLDLLRAQLRVLAARLPDTQRAPKGGEEKKNKATVKVPPSNTQAPPQKQLKRHHGRAPVGSRRQSTARNEARPAARIRR